MGSTSQLCQRDNMRVKPLSVLAVFFSMRRGPKFALAWRLQHIIHEILYQRKGYADLGNGPFDSLWIPPLFEPLGYERAVHYLRPPFAGFVRLLFLTARFFLRRGSPALPSNNDGPPPLAGL